MFDKYADCRSLVRKTPEWLPCCFFSDPWGNHFSYGLDWDSVYREMQKIPYEAFEEKPSSKRGEG